MVSERDRLGTAVTNGELDRDDALALLDYFNQQKRVFNPFKDIFYNATRASLGGRDLSKVEGITFDEDKNVTVTLNYPIPILRRTDRPLKGKSNSV